MNRGIFLALLALALAFVYIDEPLAAGICVLAAFFIAFASTGKKTAKGGKATAKSLSQGVMEEVEKSDGTYPDGGVFVEGIRNAADLTGQQMFAKDGQEFRYKGHGASVGAAERIMAYFKKLFR